MMIGISKYIKDNKLKILVKANASKNEILGWDKDKQTLKVAIKAEPEKGKANKEIIKFFTKLFKKKITIKSGLTSRQKIILIK